MCLISISHFYSPIFLVWSCFYIITLFVVYIHAKIDYIIVHVCVCTYCIRHPPHAQASAAKMVFLTAYMHVYYVKMKGLV